MTIKIELPPNLNDAAAHRAEIEAREAAAVQLYRDGELSRGQVASFLAVDAADVDDILDRHAVGILTGVTPAEIAQQAETLRRVRQGNR